MSLTTYILGISFVLYLFNRRISAWNQRRRLSSIHGCEPPAKRFSYDPILNADLTFEAFKWIVDGRRVKEVIDFCRRANHTITYTEIGKRIFVTSDPQNAKAILATDFDSWGMGPRRQKPFASFISQGILTHDGEAWAHSRKMIKPTFDRKRVTGRDIFEPHLDRFMKLLPRDGSTVHLEHYLDPLTLDAATQFVFGRSINAQNPGEDGPGRDFKWHVDYVAAALGKKSVLGHLAFLYQDAQIQRSCKAVHGFVDACIEAAIKDSMPTGDHVPLVYDILKQCKDPEVLRFELIHVYFAAQETTAITLTNVMWLMARHPDKWARLREEVKGLKPEDLTFEGIKSVRYLQWCIKETLRLHGPVASTTRVALRPTTLPSGGGADGTKPVAVAAGDHCTIVIKGIHLRKDIHGDDADEYRPERWEKQRTSWEFLSFSGGPRVCPGQQLALFWISCTLARMAMEIKTVENRDEVFEYVEQLNLSLKNRRGAQVALHWA